METGGQSRQDFLQKKVGCQLPSLVSIHELPIKQKANKIITGSSLPLSETLSKNGFKGSKAYPQAPLKLLHVLMYLFLLSVIYSTHYI